MEPETLQAMWMICIGAAALALVLALFIESGESYWSSWFGAWFGLTLLGLALFGAVKLVKWMWVT